MSHYDYISGLSNPVADALSCCFDLPWPELMSHLTPHMCQSRGCQVWTPSLTFASAVISAMLRKKSPKESVLAAPAPPSKGGTSGSSSALRWASTSFSNPLQTQFQSYKSSSTEHVPANLQPTAVKYVPDRLKITYGQLHRRSLQWVTKTPT